MGKMSWSKVFFVFLGFGLLIYFNSFNNKFLIDDYYFLANSDTTQLKSVLSAWNPYQHQTLGANDSQEHLGYYRPLATMAQDLSYILFKKNYWQFHLFNL